MKKILKNLKELEWYYQLFIALISFVLLAFLIKFLIWIIPILLGLVILLGAATKGEIFFIPWQRYKQKGQTTDNPLYEELYHWLTEEGATELPISSLIFTQGVEVAGQGIYFVHIDKEISDETLVDFETKVRQVVKTLSNDSTDCVVSRSKREPFLAVKVRLVSADMMLMKNNTREEDF